MPTPLRIVAEVTVDAGPADTWRTATDWSRQREWIWGTRVSGGHGIGAGLTAWTGIGPTPITYLAPGGSFLVLRHHETHPPIAMLARPYLALAGVRLDAALGARRRMRRLTGLSVVRPADGAKTRLDLPAGSQVGPPIW